MKTLDGTLYWRALNCSGPQSAHTRVVSRAGGQIPLWVNRVILVGGHQLPIFPWKRTLSGPVAMLYVVSGLAPTADLQRPQLAQCRQLGCLTSNGRRSDFRPFGIVATNDDDIRQPYSALRLYRIEALLQDCDDHRTNGYQSS